LGIRRSRSTEANGWKKSAGQMEHRSVIEENGILERARGYPGRLFDQGSRLKNPLRLKERVSVYEDEGEKGKKVCRRKSERETTASQQKKSKRRG